MLKNYIKIAWRNLTNNKVYSALNITGLSIGMAVALLIGLWVQYQYSYDRFLPNYEYAYSVRIRYVDNGEMGVGPATPLPLADALKRDIPGVRYVAQSDWMGAHGLVVGDRRLYPAGAMASADFLKIFQYPLLSGDVSSAMKDPYSIILTESTAKSLFGDEDPMNKMVRIDNRQDLKVTGILRDLPKQSTFRFNYLVPFSFYMQNPWVKRNIGNWNDNSFQTFVALEPDADLPKVESQIGLIFKKHIPEDFAKYQSTAILYPLKKWHLYNEFENGVASDGFIGYVRMFSIIGILVLLIACINFMNLATARSEKRAREVGVRKTLGSHRNALILQFLTESFMITLISAFAALGLVQLVLPSFNTLTQTSLTIPYNEGLFWLVMTVYVILTGLLAGSRPAFYLSSFNPVAVLKGTLKIGSSAVFSRKALVVAQFTCSIALIISTIIVYQQIQHAKNRPVGFDANRLMMTDGSDDLSNNYTALKDDLRKSGMVSSVTKSSSPITGIWSNTGVESWSEKQPGETLDLAIIGVGDTDYFKTMGMNLLDGRNFTGAYSVDSATAIINEAAAKRMRFKDPVNQVLTWKNTPNQIRIIGVVNDALMVSPYDPAEPTIFTYMPGNTNIISYRLSQKIPVQEAVAKLQPIFNKYNPSFPYLYQFADESYAAKFRVEMLVGKLAGLFAGLAIFISSLGLFGLSAYMVEKRTKEIGIRKVLGASVSQVWALLSKDFVGLILTSCIISAPLALYFLQNWLDKFSYRISIGPEVFVISALMALIISIFTISFQAIKAALMNPVKSLRSE
ncbi:MAG TPA: ABC transporter permease [Daejeonella sp.]|uniref:ABC transporter permease n=1 Tax=Daejeonella sp. TaxID=2805397 RepID=UPI002EDB74E8